MAETAMSRTEDHIRRTEKYGAHNYHPLPVVIERGERIWVWDVDGNKYMDCLSAYSALNQGHCHPRLVKVMTEQAKKVTLTSRAFHNAEMGAFLEELCTLTGKEAVLPMNSGAEAVETAIKAARKWGYQKKGVAAGQAEIIVLQNNFHGRTTTIVGFSTEEQYKEGFGPFTPGFVTVPFGDADAVKKAITPNTVAVMVEPIQGEGGVIVPVEGYHTALREICTRENVLLIDDEIQTGLGRTGKRFAMDYEGVEADVYILGKALSGGFYPVSAIACNREIMDVFHPGDHGSTFGGSPMACAVAREALCILRDEKLIENSHEMGEYFMAGLRDIGSPKVKEIRGKGLLIGVELTDETGPARPFCEALMKRGILCKETHESVIRFAPPLVIQKDEIDWVLGHVREVLA